MGLADASTTGGNLRDGIISARPKSARPEKGEPNLRISRPVPFVEYPGKFINHRLQKREGRRSIYDELYLESASGTTFFTPYLLSRIFTNRKYFRYVNASKNKFAQFLYFYFPITVALNRYSQILLRVVSNLTSIFPQRITDHCRVSCSKYLRKRISKPSQTAVYEIGPFLFYFLYYYNYISLISCLWYI